MLANLSTLHHSLRLGLLLGLCLLAPLAWGEESRIHPPPQKRPAFARDGLVIQSADGGQHRLWVEIARTMDEHAYGLMRVRALPDTDGMLFVVPQPKPMLFWMKDTLLPLDILFLDASGTIFHIAADSEPKSERYLPSHGLAKGVLEISGGMAERWHIRTGDRVIYRDFTPPPPEPAKKPVQKNVNPQYIWLPKDHR